MSESPQQIKRRTEILESARQIFSNVGFHKADMNEIAQKANIAKGTVYLYFSSKKDLFISLIREGLVDLTHKIGVDIENLEDPVERIKRSITTYMTFFEENQSLYRILLHPDKEIKDDIEETWKDYTLSKIPALSETLNEGIELGKLRTMDTITASYMILGMVDQVLHQWMTDPSSESMKKKIEQINDLLFNGITK
jgi:TetR/AcrR family transcriptional regulator, fatty acid metabolism regulator protein